MRVRQAVLVAATVVISLGSIASGFGIGAVPAYATPSSQLCDGSACLNRDGGGTGNGTPVISWYENDNNNFFALGALSSWCGGTGIVRDGEGGQYCPFSNHSFDARYDGDHIYTVDAIYNGGSKCVALDPGSVEAALEPCGSTGDAFVRSSYGYMVSVYETNNGGIPDQIEWLTYQGYGVPVTEGGDGNAWNVVG